MNRRDFIKIVASVATASAVPAFAVTPASPVKTTHTALDLLNSRRLGVSLVHDVREAYLALLLETAFQVNDDITRNLFRTRLSDVVQTYCDKRVIYQFVVICDESNNSPDIVNTGIVAVDVYYKEIIPADIRRITLGPDLDKWNAPHTKQDA